MLPALFPLAAAVSDVAALVAAQAAAALQRRLKIAQKSENACRPSMPIPLAAAVSAIAAAPSATRAAAALQRLPPGNGLLHCRRLRPLLRRCRLMHAFPPPLALLQMWKPSAFAKALTFTTSKCDQGGSPQWPARNNRDT